MRDDADADDDDGSLVDILDYTLRRTSNFPSICSSFSDRSSHFARESDTCVCVG